MSNGGIRLLWFAFGVTVGMLVVIFGNSLMQPEQLATAKHNLPETDPEQLISIRTETDVIASRKELNNFIWGPQGLPSKLPEKIETAIWDQRFSKLANLKQIDRLSISMDWGLTSTAYHFVPLSGHNNLLIYHQGHDGDFVRGLKTIGFFLEKGFSVIALSMPMEAPNNQPVVDIPRVGKITLRFHEQLKLLEMKNGHPVQLFLTPVAVSLNYAEKTGYDRFYMTGYSGGGWTTTLYAAIDPRIKESYPVAGSLPLHLRSDSKVFNTAMRSADWGDYEQTIPELYRIANYLDLYILGSIGSGRRQVQVLNKYDPCCFSGDAYQSYEKVVRQRVQSMGQGDFSVHLDTGNEAHNISAGALGVMLAHTGHEVRISQK